MLKQWFINKLAKIMAHNDYKEDWLTVETCDKNGKWTPCDLIAREYLNNGGGSAKGFLGISTGDCLKCYYYMKEVKEELVNANMVSEKGWNNFGFPLWENYDF